MMDKSSSVTAAFAAGKLPSQQQFSKAVDRSLDSPFLTTKLSPDAGELSTQGKQLQEGIRRLLLAYKKLGDNKNGEFCVFHARSVAERAFRGQHCSRVALAPLGGGSLQYLHFFHGRRFRASRSRLSWSCSLAAYPRFHRCREHVPRGPLALPRLRVLHASCHRRCR